ncbi:MAG: hypothetical protein AB8B83_07535 [Bdellovibrionales bacterium]
MGWPRTFFLNTAIVTGGLFVTFGAAAAAWPAWHDNLSLYFDDVAADTGANASSALAGIAALEPASSLMIGTALVAYGVFVPKNP